LRYSPYRKLAKQYYPLRWIARWFHALTRYQNWRKIARSPVWQQAVRGGQGGARILIPTSVGGHIAMTHVESVLAVALTLRGANVEFLLCDAALPACVACEVGYPPGEDPTRYYAISSPFCRSCFAPARRSYASLGLRVHRFSELLTEADRAEATREAETVDLADIRRLTRCGVGIGEQAYAGALRFFARGDLAGQDPGARVQRQYVQAAFLTARVMQRLLERFRYDCAVFNHGIYVPQGIVGDVCRQSGLRVVNWNPAYKTGCFIFSHGDSYHHTMMSEPVAAWESMEWDERKELHLNEYLRNRQQGTEDWIWFNENPQPEVDGALELMGLRPSVPTIGLLTSVMWDAALHYPSNAFSNQFEWVFDTITYFRKRPDLQLLIRIHPAEIQGGLPSRQRILDEIRTHFPDLPPNVFVVPPESQLSTYALMDRCNAVIIYNTKTGIELAATGMPVIVAGEAWIRGKGFAMDVSNREDYVWALDRLPFAARMSDEDTLRAKKYAYHFFFRRMIPLEFMEPTNGNPPFRINIKSIEDLLPGRSRGLDLICEGILNETDFIFDS
jgi:hypothetical protein